ncbi:MAG: DUF3313 domain-containing protein [Deltaproteobacteria bacterium]|nr:DUF3313 domain-containing protein [Deltaproteobacteria bacterium]MBW2393040.1 DUF3313 domain-containing protein [Deltaproteobacteria bacterium]
MNIQIQAYVSRALALVVLLVVSASLVACPTLRARRAAPTQRGFLGDYSQLQKIKGYDAQLLYINPDARWTDYDAVQIDSVTLWAGEGTERLEPEDQQMLTDLLYMAIHDELGAHFRIVEEPGPGVVRLRIALTQAKPTFSVPLRTITTVIPKTLVIGTIVGLSLDTANTVGSATLEAAVEDPITGARLASAVDERVGVKSLLSANMFKTWGDVNDACHFWAKRAARFLAREGVQRKPGAPPIPD